MKPCRFASILIIAVVCAFAIQATAQAELRFGPWVYWAPYYYPSPEKLRQLGFTSKDFAPRYQSPNPIAPKSDGYVPPPPPPRKVAARSPQRGRVATPVANAPRVQPQSVSRPRSTLRKPRISSQPTAARSTRAASPPPDAKRLYWGSRDKPRAIGSDPGSR